MWWESRIFPIEWRELTGRAIADWLNQLEGQGAWISDVHLAWLGDNYVLALIRMEGPAGEDDE